MPAINLGSMGNIGGKTVITGSATGLDTEALVKALGDAKRLPAVKLEKNIEQNVSKIDALNELSSILDTFRDAANFLRNPPGVGNQIDNIFGYNTGTVASNSAVAGSNYLSTTIAAGVDPSSYTLTVDQVATRQTRVTNTFAAADLTAVAVGGGGPFNAGVLQLGAGLTPITLTNGDTLSDVLSKVNAAKDISGVEMTAVKVSTGNYRFIFKATETGTSQNFDFTTNNAGMLNTGFFAETDAVDAMLTIDGTQVTRETNNIDDIIDGITFELKQATPLATELTLNVAPDTEVVKNAITNFVNAYNDFRIFAAKQSETTDDGAASEDAILGSSTVLRTMINSIGQEIAGVVNGIASGPDSLAGLGITLTDYAGDDETPFVRNILTIDDAKLSAAISGDFDGVRQVFEFTAVSDNANLVVYSRTNALNGKDIQFNIDQTGGIFEATVDGGAPITLTMTALPGGGVSLTGPDGSDLEGLVVLFTDTGDAVVNLTVSQGIGDRLYNALDEAMDEDNGLVATEVASLGERNDRLEVDITRIDDMVERFRQMLLERFSALESAVSSVNSILQLLDAQSAARQANS